MKIFKRDFGYDTEQELIDDVVRATKKVDIWKNSIGVPALIFKTPIKEIILGEEYEYINMSEAGYIRSLLTEKELEDLKVKELEDEKTKANNIVLNNLLKIDMKSIRALREQDTDRIAEYEAEAIKERAKLK